MISSQNSGSCNGQSHHVGIFPSAFTSEDKVVLLKENGFKTVFKN